MPPHEGSVTITPSEVGSSPGPPRRGTARSRGAMTWLLARVGWRVTGEFPTAPKAVLILAPHTSNWDFFVCMPAMFAAGLRITWIAKHTLFFFPAAPILRWLGGEPINRRVRSDTVQHAVERFTAHDRFYLGIAPEGTRRRVAEWKSGFWHIARGAGVPIIPVALDYATREVRLTPAFVPGDDEAADLAAIRGRYACAMARHPEKFAESGRATP